jgi:hypothetical protein
MGPVCHAAAEVQADFVDSMVIENNEMVSESWYRTDAVIDGAMS